MANVADDVKSWHKYVKLFYLYKAGNFEQKCSSWGSSAAQFHVRSAEFFIWKERVFYGRTILNCGPEIIFLRSADLALRSQGPLLQSAVVWLRPQDNRLWPHKSYADRNSMKLWTWLFCHISNLGIELFLCGRTSHMRSVICTKVCWIFLLWLWLQMEFCGP